MTWEEDPCTCGHERQDHNIGEFEDECACGCCEFTIDRDAIRDDYEWEAHQ